MAAGRNELIDFEVMQVLNELNDSLEKDGTVLARTNGLLATFSGRIPGWLVQMIVAVRIARYERFKVNGQMGADGYMLFTRVQIPLVLRARLAQLHDHGHLGYWVGQGRVLLPAQQRELEEQFPELVGLPVEILLPVLATQQFSFQDVLADVPEKWQPDVEFLLTKMKVYSGRLRI